MSSGKGMTRLKGVVPASIGNRIIDVLYKNQNYSSYVESVAAQLLLLLLQKDDLLSKSFDEKSGKLVLTDDNFYYPIYEEMQSEGIEIYHEEANTILGLHPKDIEEQLKNDFEIIFKHHYSRLKESLVIPIEVELYIKELCNNNIQNMLVQNSVCASFSALGNESSKYWGVNEHKIQVILGKLILLARNQTNFTFNETSIPNNYFDAVCSLPPLRRGTSIDNEYIIDHLNYTNDSGFLILILPFSFLFDSRAQETREMIVKNNLLDTIIELPSYIFANANIKTVVLLLNRNKDNTLFSYIDGSSTTVKKGRYNSLDWKKLSTEVAANKNIIQLDVSSHKFDKQYDLYLPPQINIYQGVKFGDISQSVRGMQTKKSLIGKVVDMSVFRNHSDLFSINSNNIERATVTPSMKELSESAMVLTTVGGKILSNYFEFTGEPIYLNTFTQAFKVDDKIVDYRYLILALKSEVVTEQLAMIAKKQSTTIPVRNIRDLKIELPSLAEQRNFVDNFILEIEKTEYLRDAYKRTIEEFSTLRHKVAGQASNLPFFAKKIKQIVWEKIEPELSEVFNLQLKSSKYTFGQLLDFMEEQSVELEEMLAIQSRKVVDLDNLNKQPVDLISFLWNYCKVANEKSYFEVTFQVDEISKEETLQHQAFIFADENALRVLLNNLLENADKHAFDGKTENIVEVSIFLYEEDNEVVLQVSNTGRPFPDNFTGAEFKQKGIRAGKADGNGIGGWLVNQIVLNHGGTLEYINERDYEDYWATSFDITFPLTQKIEDDEI